ncbi:MetQ/NlpA family ABC transporter substrate-binding protein [Herbaspirillum sp. DW155]|uniref:MetQ/NlpA family ABC transporter substrate-binding protein n=2 Tax=Herbaspirillum sp. DW155 TaxID=3095609 RepID=UPI00308F9F77|nr:MetQ/NlpA family ABC transporter substrate-binding protein [Herbaspirillum sp. DW155]
MAALPSSLTMHSPSRLRNTLCQFALALSTWSLLHSGALAADPAHTTLRLGATSGPYSDQLRYGVVPVLEKQGYKVKIVEFSDYVRPNMALADGDIDANLFQHEIYLKRFAQDHQLKLSEVIKVPTAPIGIYSKRHRSLAEVRPGATVALPNDATNMARALGVLQEIGWIKLNEQANPTRVSERDIVSNIKQVKLIALEAAQMPRALEDVDFAFVNGAFAIASGLKLTQALHLASVPDSFLMVVAVRSADLDKPFVKDLRDAFRSPTYRKALDERFEGYVRPDYLK